MAIPALAKPWQDLKRAYAGSALARFMTWWRGELAGWLPGSLRDAVVDRPEQLLLKLQSGAVEFWRERDDAPLLALSDEQPPEEQQRELARVLGQYEVPPRIVYRVGVERLLRRQLALPAAAEDNLRKVLGFELDRQTPFRAEQVYYDCRIAGRDQASRQLQVELAMVPRAMLDHELQRIEASGLALDAVDGEDAGGVPLGLNLLPPERRAQRRDWRLRLNLALAALAVLLVFGVLYESVQARSAALASLQQQVDKSKREARAVGELKRSLSEAVDGANFLALRRGQQPVVIELIRDLNQRLPEDTYLMRFSLNNGDIQIQGLSTDASKLVPLLQQSQLIEAPQVQGAISPDPRTKKEQFVISAKPRVSEPVKNDVSDT